MVILSNRSKASLVGVHPHLVKVVMKVCELYEGDFIITEGVRTLERQKQLVKEKKSQTMKSRHLTGKAVDLCVLINGQISWKIEDYYTLCDVFHKASQLTKIPVRWGGCWVELDGSYRGAKNEMQAYIKAKKASGGRPFIDGPHFELPLRVYG